MKTLLSALYTLLGVILCAFLLMFPISIWIFNRYDFLRNVVPDRHATFCTLSAIWILWTVITRITKTGKYK